MNQYKLEIKWGVIFMAAMLLWMVLERAVGLHDVYIDKHPIYTNFFALVAIAIYVLALLDKRKADLNGKMTYKQGVICGLLITLVVTILSPLGQYLTQTVITPNYFTNAINFAISHELMTEADAKAYFNLKSYMLQATIGAPVMGILTSLIVAIFTKKV